MPCPSPPPVADGPCWLERIFTSRSTLQRVEAGEPAVGMGLYAAFMHALGLLNGLGQWADPSENSVGQALANASLLQRIRLKPQTS